MCENDCSGDTCSVISINYAQENRKLDICPVSLKLKYRWMWRCSYNKLTNQYHLPDHLVPCMIWFAALWRIPSRIWFSVEGWMPWEPSFHSCPPLILQPPAGGQSLWGPQTDGWQPQLPLTLHRLCDCDIFHYHFYKGWLFLLNVRKVIFKRI